MITGGTTTITADGSSKLDAPRVHLQLNYICGYSMTMRIARTILARLSSTCLLCGALALGGCSGDDTGGGGNESEVITTVRLTFTQSGGTPVVAEFTDPDGDGGMSGSSNPIVINSGATYDLSIDFLDALVDPAIDIGAEVAEEAEEHQIFITGTGLEGPATAASPSAPLQHAYTDLESDYGENAVGDDLPVGLSNTIVGRTPGAGTFVVTLRHLPELNGEPQKVAGLAEQLAAGEPLPGDVDAAVEFELTVQ
jgi:hypothetical protein